MGKKDTFGNNAKEKGKLGEGEILSPYSTIVVHDNKNIYPKHIIVISLFRINPIKIFILTFYDTSFHLDIEISNI